jgi:hypothetical protein
VLKRANYRIHTDAIKENLIPPELTKQQTTLVYASETDVLNASFPRAAWECSLGALRPVSRRVDVK